MASQTTLELAEQLETILRRSTQRAMTGVNLEAAIASIWGYCWINQGSNESQKHCAEIKRMVNGAMVDVESRMDDMVDDHLEIRKQNTTLRRTLKDARSDNKRLEGMLEAAKNKTKQVEAVGR